MAKRASPTLPNLLALIDPRWTSLGYGLFALTLLAFNVRSLPSGAQVDWLSPRLLLLVAFLITAPLAGALLVPLHRWQRVAGLALMLLNVVLVLGITAASGGIGSPFWIAFFIPMFAALLLLPRAGGIGVAVAIWLSYGSFLVITPPELRQESALLWMLHSALIWLFWLILDRFMAGQRSLSRRTQRRELALQKFLEVSNRLRVSTRVQTVLEEVASTVQAAGDFDCVALCRMDWSLSQAQVAVAIGASSRRLAAVEGLTLDWKKFADLIESGKTVGAHATLCQHLPFRSIRNEYHLVLPLVGQFGEVHGLLTVSASRARRTALYEALPLLELLANQATAALDNTTLFTTLEQRVQQATADLERGASELRRARDRAEVLYHIARALSVTLDEKQVLEQALVLVAQSTGAERGGIMLVEPNSGRLIFRTSLDRHKAGTAYGLERGQGLASWVLENRKVAVVADTAKDPRWQARSTYDTRSRSVLAVPLLLENEALGVFVLIHSQTNHFNKDHAQLAMAAASQAAVALSKAQLYSYVSDQSERLSAIVQQREEEASKSLAILRSIGDGVIVGDRMGRIRMINPAAEHILGLQAEVFLGRPLVDLPGAVQEEMRSADHLHQISLGERTVRAHFAPVVSSKDDWLGSVVVYHDITREVLADKLKSEFVATASHELRTPLTSIRGYVDMLKLGTFGTLTEAQRDFLAIIKNNVNRLVELVDELLDISRAEAGETRLRREDVDMSSIVRETTESLYGQFNERSISLHLEIQDSLPMVRADPQRLQQIIVNLVGNACKYTPQGGHVNVSLCNGNNELRVDVRDSGVGIAEGAKPHIFTPFYRADNSLRDEVGGTGLGLSITRKLVELHGGRIWFESIEGQGSTFSFTLPITQS